MTTQLAKVVGKISDYKICTKCYSLNFYENNVCHCCYESNFDNNLVQGYINDEYSFYENEEGYTETEIDDIEVSC